MEPYQILERDWAKFNDLDPAGMVACASGTSALHLAFEALRLPLGSEVIMGDFNMIACPRATVMAGLMPVFVDCGDDLNIDPVLAREYVNSNPSGMLTVLATHIYGRRCDIGGLLTHGPRPIQLVCVEDLAEAHGVQPHSCTDAACWSFYRNKIVAGEEGGSVWFRNPEHAALARQLRCLGFTDAHDFRHIPRGHNYRMSNAHAHLIIDSLRRVGENTVARRRMEAAYNRVCPVEWKMPPRDAPWVYDIKIPGMTSITQARVVQLLNGAGVSTRHGFWPMSKQAEFEGCRRVGGDKALLAAQEVIYLPLTKTTGDLDLYAQLALSILKSALAK